MVEEGGRAENGPKQQQSRSKRGGDDDDADSRTDGRRRMHPKGKPVGRKRDGGKDGGDRFHASHPASFVHFSSDTQ